MELDRTAEIEKGFDHAVQTQDLASDDFHLRRDIGVSTGKLCLGHLDMQQDGMGLRLQGQTQTCMGQVRLKSSGTNIARGPTGH